MGLLDGTTQQEYYNGNALGGYQFTSLDNVITQFQIAYVGEDKIISKIKRADIAFHAQRALQELSFDTFKSCKAQEVTVSPSLSMDLPQDYVNYTKVSWVDSAGIKHLLYPTSKTSNPPKINQNTDGTYYSNLVLNPSLQSNIDNWTNNYTTTTTVISASNSSNGVLLSTNGIGSTQYPNIQQTVTLVDGQTYRLSWNLVGFDNGGAGSSKVFLFGGTGGVNGYRPVGNVALTTIGTQTPLEFTYDASQNNNINTMGLVIEMTDGYLYEKKVEIKDFLLSAVNNDGNSLVSTPLVSSDDSTTWSNYKSGTPSENQDDYQDDTYWPMDGSRYGLDPQHAQTNGSFYIDCTSGKIHFSSNISGKTVILDYISDSLGTDGEMQVHKFAEEAVYKWVAHAILATRANTPEYLVSRFKKERFAAIRTAKLRLSNIKLEEITQILRGKSKQIKH
jgi:hypothetical protein|tara:strand:+ start:878 stop:2221 length:1344 start_codon:yes stop_codon:yes gene_type:complete